MKPIAVFALLFLFASASCAAPFPGAMYEAEPASDYASEPTSGFALPGEGWDRADATMGLSNRSAEAPEARPRPQEAGPSRQVIYSAALAVVVVSIAEAQSSVLSIATEAGGHLQESDARSITVRVPAAKFDATVARIGRLGEVVDRSITALDVTEELFDLDIRLENALKARERLLEHLAKSERIEDTLKIEAELTRVTGEIERMEGRKRFLASRVALSTIHVHFNSPVNQGAGQSLAIPFDWVARLGDGLVAGAVESRPREPRFLSRGPRFDVPAAFLRYYQSSDLVEAMDAEGLRIKVQRQANHDEGRLEFWQTLARRALVEVRSVKVDAVRELTKDRVLLTGSREVAGEVNDYMLVLLRTDRRIFTFEAWGPRERFAEARAALEASAASLRP